MLLPICGRHLGCAKWVAIFSWFTSDFLMMSTQLVPRSLERTTFDEHLIIYFLILNKSNKESSIINRTNLPPTLSCGELNLNQKIEYENDNGETMKGKIVYIRAYRCFHIFCQMICLLKFYFTIDTSRQNCIFAQNQFLEERKQKKTIIRCIRCIWASGYYFGFFFFFF